ncbi:hypothetical protein GC194_00515 [bacterium]|nr:hypothetical protein [bacterium]
MNKFLLHLAYDGSGFRGWQRQKVVASVQQTLEESLCRVLGETVTLLGCGRTDAQVHASQYFAQFTCRGAVPEKLAFILNKNLPESIRIYDVIAVPAGFNVLHQATCRHYHYYFHTLQNPFIQAYSSYYTFPTFQLEKAGEVLALYKQFNDFKAYCLTPEKHNHTLVTLENATIQHNPQNGLYCIHFAAKRFLKGMVRALVYDVLQVASGQVDLDVILQKLSDKNRTPHLQLAHPQGLYLSQIEYRIEVPPPLVEPIRMLL